MLRLALFAAVALTFMAIPTTEPATPTPEPSDCPYLRITVAERPESLVDVNAFAGCVSGDERTMTLCVLDATGADHGCVRSEGESERASFGLSATCTLAGAGVAPYRIEATITDAAGLVRRTSQPLETGIAC